MMIHNLQANATAEIWTNAIVFDDAPIQGSDADAALQGSDATPSFEG